MTRKLIKELTLAIFITASCNFALELHHDYLDYLEAERISRETGWTVCTFGPPQHLRWRFFLEFFLIIALIGSRLKRLRNTLSSIIGLSGAMVSYIFWWRYYFRILELSGAGPDAIENYAYLVHGTFVDIAIAGGVVLLVVLNILDAAASSFRLNSEIDNRYSSNGPSQT